jgi:hypothetical protein
VLNRFHAFCRRDANQCRFSISPFGPARLEALPYLDFVRSAERFCAGGATALGTTAWLPLCQAHFSGNGQPGFTQMTTPSSEFDSPISSSENQPES